MKESGKIYNLMKLFSGEEKIKHKSCKQNIEALTTITQKFIEDLKATNYWEVLEANNNPLTKYFITTADHIVSNTRKRKCYSIICDAPLKGYILVFDPKLEEFLEDYK